MELIDGKSIARSILNDVTGIVASFESKPVFCDVLVGNDPVIASFVRIKAQSARRCGILFKEANFPASIDQEALLVAIQDLNRAPGLAGLIVQLPLPDHIDARVVIDAIDPRLDVDCLTTTNKALFYQGQAVLVPPTAAAILHILRSLPVAVNGHVIAVVGQGDLVGKPVTFLCRQAGWHVVTADKNTADLRAVLRDADIVVSGTGVPGLITGDMIKPGAVVIDAGTSESEGGIVGDVDYPSVSKQASFISPVPGGVGPITVAKLLENVVAVAKQLSTTKP